MDVDISDSCYLNSNPGSGWSLGTVVNAECRRGLWLHVHEMIGWPLVPLMFFNVWVFLHFSLLSRSSCLSRPPVARLEQLIIWINSIRSLSLLLLPSLCRQHSVGPHLHKQLDRLSWLQPSCCSDTHPVWSMSPDELLRTLACLLPIWLHTTIRPADL